jgi:hypothetical protein
MSNLIPQLNRPPDVMRPVSVRVASRVAAGAPISPVTEVSASNSMPPVQFAAGDNDSLATAFPSLAVITRRILNGMQEAMDRAIEDAAREAIESQRQQAQVNAAQQAQRQADLEEALVALSETGDTPAEEKQAGAIPGSSGTTGTATIGAGSEKPAVETQVVGGANEPDQPTDDVAFSRPAGRAEQADIGPSFGSRATLNRSEAGQVLSDVTKTVRAGPRSDVEKVHRPENLAYSAMLLNG